jgi:hypothetical protein
LLREEAPCGHIIEAWAEGDALHIYAPCPQCRQSLIEAAANMPEIISRVEVKD